MARNRSRLSLIALAASGLVGCSIYSGATEGENGVLSFYEPNDYPADEALSAQGFELPIALGARADVWVLSEGLGSIESAESADPDVISSSLVVYPIELRARAVGTTSLRVSLTTGSDTLRLTVVAPDGARIWTLATTSFGTPDGYFGKGYALRKGASLRVAGQPTVGMRPLLGFDILDWSIDPTLLAHHGDAKYVNTRRIEALGRSGVTEISTQLGGALEVATLSDTEIPTLRIYADNQPNPTEITALAPADVTHFLLAANDAAGRYVVPGPQDDASFTATVTSGSVTVLEASRSGHYASLRACTGSGVIKLSYMGAERSVAITVTPALADATCP